MASSHRIAGLVVLMAVTAGCTRVVVHKNPGYHDRGFRYWRPKPYLFIGPLAPEEKKAADSGGEDTTTTKPGSRRDAADKAPVVIQQTTPTIKIAMQIKYLPDYNEEYSIKLLPGIGAGKLSFQLADGWNLTSVGIETDQKLPELISSFASLIGALRGGGGGGGAKAAAKADFPAVESDLYIVDTRPDVPLGFYEPIIATDSQGQKCLFGWRYVGFLPFAGCPVEACVHPKTVTCDPSELWGIVSTPNSLKFQRLSEIEAGAWPYQYRRFKPVAGGNAPPPWQQPVAKDKSGMNNNQGADDAEALGAPVSETSGPRK